MVVEDKDREEAMQQDVPTLNQLYFYLTEGCNLACRHCWLSPKFDEKGDRYPILPFELFELAINEAKPMGLKSVKLSGGEPLLHPRFKDMLEVIRREDFSLSIETNGVLCTPDIAAEIAKCRTRFVSVSLDGADAATHEWVRGVPGCFEKTKQAARNLVAVGIAPQVIMSIMRHNVEQVDAVVHMAEELGASSVKFNIVQPTGRGEKIYDSNESLDIHELIRLGRYIEQELAPTVNLTLIFSFPIAFESLSHICNSSYCSVCGIFGIMGVIADGHYALCGIGKHVPEFVFGTVGKDPLEKVWRENPVLNELRAGLPEKLEGVCARCLMKSSCLGDCIAQNYYRTGSLWAPFWFCEQAEEAGLFPETRLGAVNK